MERRIKVEELSNEELGELQNSILAESRKRNESRAKEEARKALDVIAKIKPLMRKGMKPVKVRVRIPVTVEVLWQGTHYGVSRVYSNEAVDRAVGKCKELRDATKDLEARTEATLEAVRKIVGDTDVDLDDVYSAVVRIA